MPVNLIYVSLIYGIQQQDQQVNQSGKHSRRLVAKLAFLAADKTLVTANIQTNILHCNILVRNELFQYFS